MENQQKNVGSNNTNNSNSNNIFYCSINIDGENKYIDILSIFKSISKKFEDEDDEINSSLLNKVIVNKTQQEEIYRTEKIITSLLQLGIPLIATYEIVEMTVQRIREYIENFKKENGEKKPTLSTKQIREMVSLSIQQMNIEKYTYTTIENWNNKYIRRYGHDNRRVTIYYPSKRDVTELSYDFINNEFLEDVVNDITKGKMKSDELSAKYKNEVATEILEFINNCDLYTINYKTLKDIIEEIALQPPHPWFINKNTKENIIDYDKNALISNINTLKQAIDKQEDSPQPVKIEILHHASALILEKYNYFLGCYDLSSFYLLRNFLKELDNSDNWNLTIENSKFSNILTDLVFSNIQIIDFLDCINQIDKLLSKQRINSTLFDELLVKYGNFALQLFDLGCKQEIHDFLNTNWKTIEKKTIITFLKKILYSIYPVRIWNLEYNEDYFWIIYKDIKSNVIDNIKKQFLIVFVDSDGFDRDLNFLGNLKAARTRNLCNTILVIGEEKRDVIHYYNIINKYLIENNLEQSYLAFWLSKEELNMLINSNNKMNCFDNILSEQLEEEL